MKQEDLKRLFEAADGFMRRVDVLAAEELLPTLLREREQLLGALRAAHDHLLWAASTLNHAWAQEGPPSWEGVTQAHEGEDAARAAIAAAES